MNWTTKTVLNRILGTSPREKPRLTGVKLVRKKLRIEPDSEIVFLSVVAHAFMSQTLHDIFIDRVNLITLVRRRIAGRFLHLIHSLSYFLPFFCDL